MDRPFLDPSSTGMRFALLTSAVGAGVLGFGAGLLLGDALPGLGWPALVAGLVLHAWGMLDRHLLEAGQPSPAWSTALYWLCWVALAVLSVVMVVRLVGWGA